MQSIFKVGSPTANTKFCSTWGSWPEPQYDLGPLNVVKSIYYSLFGAGCYSATSSTYGIMPW